MTPEEYKQLQAFTRQDGAMLSLLWIGAFVCYVLGTVYPSLGIVSMLLIITSPFFAARRLRHFRDFAREGTITFSRGYVYTILTFFYAGLLLAIIIYAYFTFIDNGYLLGRLNSIMQTPEAKQLIKIYGMTKDMEESMRTLAAMRPIDFAVNMLSVNIMTGILLGLPIAALMQRQVVKN